MDRHYGLIPEPLSEEARRILTGGRDEMIANATTTRRNTCKQCGYTSAQDFDGYCFQCAVDNGVEQNPCGE